MQRAYGGPPLAVGYDALFSCAADVHICPSKCPRGNIDTGKALAHLAAVNTTNSDSKQVLLVQNHPIETPGRVEEYLREKNVPFLIAHSYKDDELPEPDSLSHVIAFGCPKAVVDVLREKWSKRLFDYLDQIRRADQPYLGMCYAAQLMVANLGANVLPNRPKEIGVYNVTLDEAGESDQLFAGFPKTFPVFHWHGDMFDIPEGAERLATSSACANQCFRHGKNYGIQFHLEADLVKLPIWLKEYADEIPDAGKSVEQVLAEYKEVESETRRLCFLLLDNFLGH